jgi:hypothetical protein
MFMACRVGRKLHESSSEGLRSAVWDRCIHKAYDARARHFIDLHDFDATCRMLHREVFCGRANLVIG